MSTLNRSRLPVLALALCLIAAAPPTAPTSKRVVKDRDADLRKRVAAEYKNFDAFYKDIHAHPELAFQEVRTAGKLAKELRSAGFSVTEKVGGTGVVGILTNGKGPTVLVRADMDALPIVEKTGLNYASKVRVRDNEGREVGVMHACGHDLNVTCLVGTARMLVALKDKWQGTLVFIGQPAEEIGGGARAMIADGLLTRFPRPDFALALHCDARYPHGHVNYRIGQLQANVDSVNITIKGKGGHGAAPHATIDPIVIAAKLILDLQTIVSREVNPTESAVVTVGSMHAGTKHNIIPDDATLQLTVRTTTDVMRKNVLEAIKRKTLAAAQSAGAPEPVVQLNASDYTPALFNDAELTHRLMGVLREALGNDHVHERPMSLGGEDFSHFGRAGITSCYFFLGSQDPGRVAESRREGGKRLPMTHTAEYAPVPEPTITTGVVSMSLAVLELLGR